MNVVIFKHCFYITMKNNCLNATSISLLKKTKQYICIIMTHHTWIIMNKNLYTLTYISIILHRFTSTRTKRHRQAPFLYDNGCLQTITFLRCTTRKPYLQTSEPHQCTKGTALSKIAAQPTHNSKRLACQLTGLL